MNSRNNENRNFVNNPNHTDILNDNRTAGDTTINTDENLSNEIINDEELTIAQKVGRNMKELRMKKKLTQQQLADILGIPLTTYSAYELGNARQHSELLLKLAEIYYITTDKILGIKDKQLEPNTIFYIDKLGNRQMVTFTPEKFNTIILVIRTLKEEENSSILLNTNN